MTLPYRLVGGLQQCVPANRPNSPYVVSSWGTHSGAVVDLGNFIGPGGAPRVRDTGPITLFVSDDPALPLVVGGNVLFKERAEDRDYKLYSSWGTVDAARAGQQLTVATAAFQGLGKKDDNAELDVRCDLYLADRPIQGGPRVFGGCVQEIEDQNSKSEYVTRNFWGFSTADEHLMFPGYLNLNQMRVQDRRNIRICLG